MRLIIDSDFAIFESACLAQKNSIIAVHKTSGREKSFDNKTSFWGHWKKRDGGWLGSHNKERSERGLELFSPDDFEIIDVYEPLPFGHAVNVFNTRMEAITNKLGCNNISHYLSGGDSWRIEASTLIKYKGNREDSAKPIHLEEMQEYVIRKHGGERCTQKIGNYSGVAETDDVVVMQWWEDKRKGIESVVVQIDKDGMGQGTLLFNPDKMDVPLDTSGVGRLYIDDKKAVRGHGRKWLYFQCAYGDSSDNYYANSATTKKWGEKSAFQAFEGLHTDKECLEALVGVYKGLYPEPFKFTGWRGEEFEVDWLYVLRENWNMCRMMRKVDDFVDIKDVLDMMGVNY